MGSHLVNGTLKLQRKFQRSTVKMGMGSQHSLTRQRLQIAVLRPGDCGSVDFIIFYKVLTLRRAMKGRARHSLEEQMSVYVPQRPHRKLRRPGRKAKEQQLGSATWKLTKRSQGCWRTR